MILIYKNCVIMARELTESLQQYEAKNNFRVDLV